MTESEEKWAYGKLTIDDINNVIDNFMWAKLTTQFAIGFILFDPFRPDADENTGWVTTNALGSPRYHEKQIILMPVNSVLHKQIKKVEEGCEFIRFERIDEKAMEQLWKVHYFVFTDEDGVFIDLSEKPDVRKK